jgi:hypothetical protein
VFTDDSGYFNFEYKCLGKQYDRMHIESLVPYSGYVREHFPFSTNVYKDYYYSNQGIAILLLNEKTPLQPKDTLYVGLLLFGYTRDWAYLDSFIYGDNIPTHWKDYKSTRGGGRILYAAKGLKGFTEAKKTENKYQNIYWWRVVISGDPKRDTVIVNY